MDWKTLFLSPQGRINRAKYWVASLVMTAVMIVVYGVLGTLMVMTANPDKSLSVVGILAVALMVLSYIPLLYIGIMVGMKRWHDRDKSGWWMLIALVPYVGGIWIFVECGCLPGTNGSNRFGPDPLAFGRDVVDVFGAPQQTATLR